MSDTKMRSIILHSTHVIDIGLYFYTSDASPPMYTGVTMACSQAFGIWPTDMKDVNISESGSDRTDASFLNNRGGKLSGPQEFVFVSFFIAAKAQAGEKSTVLIDAE
jgi:hypothetical protein